MNKLLGIDMNIDDDYESGEFDFVTEGDGENIQTLKSYGIGIDTHSQFIHVCVLVKIDFEVKKHERQFTTDWGELERSKLWAINVIKTKSNPIPDDIEPIRYTIESTGTYHLPVLKAWGGKPSVINPLLASPSRRKTDALDAKLLAYQNMTGLWKESFIISDEMQELRLLIKQRTYNRKNATRASNMINNYILRFGYTLGKDGSVTQSSTVRGLIEDLAAGKKIPEDIFKTCPTGLPEDVRIVFTELYSQYDMYKAEQKKYEKLALAKAKKTMWKTESGEVSGKDLMKNLMTVPGIGEITSLVWLSNIVTTDRFPNSKAISAFCGLDPSLKISAGKVTSTVKRGGNKELHAALTLAAGTLLKSKSDHFGRWGFNIYKQKGSWKKAVTAVARKLSVALYHVHRLNTEFSYEKYKFYEVKEVENYDLDKLILIMPEFKRYKKLFVANNILDTKTIVDKYYNLQLTDIKGLGQKCILLVKEFIDNQNKIKAIFENMNLVEDEKKGE